MSYNYRSFKLTPVWILILINILFFIPTVINGELIVNLFGLQPSAFLQKPWGIITNLFIHSGLWHIMANMFTLYFFGTYLARLIGNNKFLGIYLGGGILGNILYILLTLLGSSLSISFLGSPYIIAIGASGAVFSLGGTLAVMRPKLRVFVFPIPLPIHLWIAVIGGFLIISFLPYIAWQAHLGGLIFGLIAGYFFKKREYRSFWSY